jgi:hypothetical protein
LKLRHGERVEWKKFANRCQGVDHLGSTALMGGNLILTSRRLAFMPYWWVRLRGGQPWSVALADIATVELAPPDSVPGNLRKLLRVRDGSGSAELFSLRGKEEAIERISTSAGRPFEQTDTEFEPRPRNALPAGLVLGAIFWVVFAVISGSVLGWVFATLFVVFLVALVGVRKKSETNQLR